VDTGFRKTSCSNNSLKRDADSKKWHRALAVGEERPMSEVGPEAHIAERAGRMRRSLAWSVARETKIATNIPAPAAQDAC
jgi:hypothetical protein